MRLSEAILLGSTMGLKMSNRSWKSCLIGIGIHAIGKDNIGNTEAEKRYPWLLQEYPTPVAAGKEMVKAYPSAIAKSIITWMASDLKEGKITLEQAVDWIASVEPKEPTAEASPIAGRDPVELERESVKV